MLPDYFSGHHRPVRVVEDPRAWWTRRLRWSWVQGPDVKFRWGAWCGWLGVPIPLRLRPARRAGHCQHCRRRIRKGALVGRPGRVCRACLSRARPEFAFRSAGDFDGPPREERERG